MKIIGKIHVPFAIQKFLANEHLQMDYQCLYIPENKNSKMIHILLIIQQRKEQSHDTWNFKCTNTSVCVVSFLCLILFANFLFLLYIYQQPNPFKNVTLVTVSLSFSKNFILDMLSLQSLNSLTPKSNL